MKTEIISIFEKREDIDKILFKIKEFSFSDFSKHPHFEFSLLEKMTNINFIEDVFYKFDLIKIVELRRNSKGQEYYSLNYELEDGTFVIIALNLQREVPMIINAFHAKRDYKKFEKSLRKNYAKMFI